MPSTIENTLKTLCIWYDEPSIGNERPKLISKFALLELCGWIEGTFDEIISDVNDLTIKDADWAKDLLNKTSGFTYATHFRPMLVNLIGEVFTRKVELEMEKNNPGDLDRLKSTLGTLWKKRCQFAHADISSNIASQAQFDSPTWSINQYRIINKLIGNLHTNIKRIVNTV
jgi:hypothetical protein